MVQCERTETENCSNTALGYFEVLTNSTFYFAILAVKCAVRDPLKYKQLILIRWQQQKNTIAKKVDEDVLTYNKF